MSKITVNQLVAREVQYCVSSMITALSTNLKEGSEFEEQLLDLQTGIPDYKEAATDAGWVDVTDTNNFPPETNFKDTSDGQEWACNGWEALCDDHDIDAYEYATDPLEFWIVSDWFADKLEAKGNKVDRDFMGLTLWARTCSGQAIACDYDIQEIHKELVA